MRPIPRPRFTTRRRATWVTTESMAKPRREHTATLLETGQVLVAAGIQDVPLSNSELYDPSAGTWTSAGSLAGRRTLHAAVPLETGGLMVVGGGITRYVTPEQLLVQVKANPALSKYVESVEAHLENLRREWDCLGSGAFRRVVNRGRGVEISYNSARAYDPSDGTWALAPGMAELRIGHTAALLPSGDLLVVGGDNGTESLASAELYSASAEEWSSTGDMAQPRQGHTATVLSDGRVLVVGGWGPPMAGDKGSTAQQARGWRFLSPSQLRSQGRSLHSAEAYDSASGSWSETGSLSSARCGHTATLLLDGTVLVAGGFGPDGKPLASVEVYDPASGTWSQSSNGLSN